MSRKGLANIENSVDTAIYPFEDYIEKRRGRLITTARSKTDNERTEINWKQKWGENNSMDVLSD